MKGLWIALWGELLKALRSRAPLVTAVAFSLAPLVGGFFMVVLEDPQRARRLGLVGAKAQLAAGRADWPSYFALLAQATAIGGLLLFGLVAIWVFGREYSQRTARDLLALPTSREAIVAAKFVVILIWCAALTGLVFVLGLAIGAWVGLPGWSAGIAFHSLAVISATAGLTVLLVAPFALVAGAGRGYLPAVGAMFLAVFLAQVLAALGWGAYFPWSVPGIYSGVAGSGPGPGAVSFVLVCLAGLAGVFGTFLWWRRADQL